MTIQPGKYNLKVFQGATFDELFTWKDENGLAIAFTGYTARMQARDDYSAVSPFMNLTTENGGITLGATDGTIHLTMNATATAAITAESGVWDLEMVAPSGAVYRLLQGSVCVRKEATK